MTDHKHLKVQKIVQYVNYHPSLGQIPIVKVFMNLDFHMISGGGVQFHWHREDTTPGPATVTINTYVYVCIYVCVYIYNYHKYLTWFGFGFALCL